MSLHMRDPNSGEWFKAHIRIISVVDADISVGVILEELQYDM